MINKIYPNYLYGDGVGGGGGGGGVITKNVTSEGGGGPTQCDGSVTGGRGGVKISVFWCDVICGCPQTRPLERCLPADPHRTTSSGIYHHW